MLTPTTGQLRNGRLFRGTLKDAEGRQALPNSVTLFCFYHSHTGCVAQAVPESPSSWVTTYTSLLQLGCGT